MGSQVHIELNAELLPPPDSDAPSKCLTPYGSFSQGWAHLSSWDGGCRGRRRDPQEPPRLRNTCKTLCSQGKGICSCPQSQSQHRAAYLLLHLGSWALLCRRVRAGGCNKPVQEARAGMDPWGKAPPATSPALDHPGA